MRRRLDLAAAIVARPPVLFLDEPTTGLDPRSRIDLWETIEDLVADGTTVLLTTQYLDEADRLADRIVGRRRAARSSPTDTGDELKARRRRRAHRGQADRRQRRGDGRATALAGMSADPPQPDGDVVRVTRRPIATAR